MFTFYEDKMLTPMSVRALKKKQATQKTNEKIPTDERFSEFCSAPASEVESDRTEESKSAMIASQVSKFYEGKTVFVTGATGFVGKLLVEKILRSCPEVEAIFFLVRAKRGKDVHERTEALFRDIGLPERIFEDSERDYQNDADMPDDSAIVKFFSGKSIFVTGATGFLGKLLVEKLLRSCPGIDTLFILARPKRGKDIDTRLEEIFNDVIYDRLAKAQPKFRHKVFPIEGDVALPGLGMSDSDRSLLVEKVHVIFHVAATVKFDEKLKLAVAINVNGTKQMLDLARDCKNLQSFLHVSTAFANCPHETIEEKFYEPPMKTQEIIKLVQSQSDELLEKQTPQLLGKWPNTYAYTKAIAENTVKEFGIGLPICIFRPAIIISTYKEPIRAWIDNIYGPTGVIIGAGTGVLHAMHAEGSNIAEIVPADWVVNGLIVASHKVTVEKERKMPIYNYVSSVQSPVTWQTWTYLNKKYGIDLPTIQAFWYYSLTFTSSRFLYMIYTLLFHFLPGAIADAAFLLSGRKPMMIKLYKKIFKFGEVISYFSTRQWTFTNDNTQNLWKETAKVDKSLFPFDMGDVDWDQHSQVHIMGLRTYLVKEDPSTLPDARKKWRRLYLAHKGLQAVTILLVLRLIYVLLTHVVSRFV